MKQLYNWASAQLMKHYAVKTYGEVVVQIHVFLTSTLVGGEWSASRPCRFNAGRLRGPQSRPERYGSVKMTLPGLGRPVAKPTALPLLCDVW
jgi:hypothetical protein